MQKNIFFYFWLLASARKIMVLPVWRGAEPQPTGSYAYIRHPSYLSSARKHPVYDV